MILNLPLVRLKLTFQLQDTLVLPSYAGSAFRGVFGSSLRRVCCLSGKSNCTGCGLMSTCPYAGIFESKAGMTGRPVNPYMIEPPLYEKRQFKAGDKITFTQILFGDCIQSLSFILLAWTKGMQFGIGQNRTRADLISVYQEQPTEDILIYSWQQEETNPINPIYTLTIPENKNHCTLKIETPLRIQRDKHPITPVNLTFGDFISSLIRRTELLYAGHTTQTCFITDKDQLLAKAKTVKDVRRDLHWQDWTRWSGRQKTHIALGGIVGEWEIEGDLSCLLPLLYAGQLLHLGKSAVMGLGKYRIF